MKHENNSVQREARHEHTVYIILTEWACEWQESVEVTDAFLTFKEAEDEMLKKVHDATKEFLSSPKLEQCDGYCELSTQGPYGTDCVKFSVVPIQLPNATPEDAA